MVSQPKARIWKNFKQLLDCFLECTRGTPLAQGGASATNEPHHQVLALIYKFCSISHVPHGGAWAVRRGRVEVRGPHVGARGGQ